MKLPSHACSLLVVVLFCAGAVSATSPTSCYVDSGIDATPIMTSSIAGGSTVMPPSGVACVRYCIACSAGDRACTNAQVASATVHPAYTYVTTSLAAAMALDPVTYPYFSQCTTTNCNTFQAWATYCAPAVASAASPPPPSPPPSPPVGAGRRYAEYYADALRNVDFCSFIRQELLRSLRGWLAHRRLVPGYLNTRSCLTDAFVCRGASSRVRSECPWRSPAGGQGITLLSGFGTCATDCWLTRRPA